MVPQNLAIFAIENCMEFVQDGDRNLIRFREEGSSKRRWCAFERTEEGVENAQTRVEEVVIKVRKGITHDLLVELVDEQWLL